MFYSKIIFFLRKIIDLVLKIIFWRINELLNNFSFFQIIQNKYYFKV